jgi:hypothetical protein
MRGVGVRGSAGAPWTGYSGGGNATSEPIAKASTVSTRPRYPQPNTEAAGAELQTPRQAPPLKTSSQRRQCPGGSRSRCTSPRPHDGVPLGKYKRSRILPARKSLPLTSIRFWSSKQRLFGGKANGAPGARLLSHHQRLVEAQMALAGTQMVTTAQVFLPYAVMRNGQHTCRENQRRSRLPPRSGKLTITFP